MILGDVVACAKSFIENDSESKSSACSSKAIDQRLELSWADYCYCIYKSNKTTVKHLWM